MSQAFPREFSTGTSAVFNAFPFNDLSQSNWNRLAGAPRAHFRQKLKIDKLPVIRTCSGNINLYEVEIAVTHSQHLRLNKPLMAPENTAWYPLWMASLFKFIREFDPGGNVHQLKFMVGAHTVKEEM